eukprot:g6324.t1
MDGVLLQRSLLVPVNGLLRLKRRALTYSIRSLLGRRRRRGLLIYAASAHTMGSKSGQRSLDSEPAINLAKSGKSEQDKIPLSFKNGSLLTHLGLSLLDEMDSAAFANLQESIDGDVVLGFNSKHGSSSMEDFNLGKLCCDRFVSSARCKLWWMTPEWGNKTSDLSPETQFLLIEIQEGGPYAIFLPLIDRGVFRATLRPPKCGKFAKNEIVLRIESGDETVRAMKWNSVLYVSAGWNPFQLLDRAIPSAARLSGGAKPRSAKELPESLDVFGWCTWDAFYSSVSARGIAEGLESLRNGGYPPRLLIIDDGWQMTDLDGENRSLPTESLHLPKQKETEAECSFAETEVLAETSTHISQETADVLMPTLAATGPPPCLIEEDEDEYNAQEEEVVAAVMDKAPPGSASVRLFTYLANGPFRKPMLNFYAMGGDFSRRLTSVKANGKFSSVGAEHDSKWRKRKENLKEVIGHLKSEFGVRYVYLWHGLSAYWSGVSNEGPEVAKYQSQIFKAKPTPGVLEVEPSLAWNPSVVAGVGVVENPDALYRDMHNYLKSAGASGVKVDAQAGAGLIGTVLGGGAALAFKWHMALENSVEKHFPGNHVINCMCHSTENLYRMLNTAVARASDDFYPRDPSSITPHIANCAYNSLFLAPLVQPDWDMFQTKHKAAELHAAARAVSGGAVYISDKPGNHDFSILEQLVLPDGTVLRAQIPGRPTRDCLFRNILKDGKTLLKIWTVNQCSGVVGVFNLQGSSWDRRVRHFRTHNSKPPILQTRVTPQDVEQFYMNNGLHSSALYKGRFAAYVFRKRELYIGDSKMCLCVELEPFGSEIVSFSPILECSRIHFAAIGLPRLLNGTGSVLSCSGKKIKLSMMKLDWSHENGNQESCSFDSQLQVLGLNPSDKCILFEVKVRGCGEFLVYTNQKPMDIWIGSYSVPFKYNEETGELKFEIEETASMIAVIQVLFK